MHQVYIRTYGCQMNERDSDQVARMFVERGGYALTPTEEDAAVVAVPVPPPDSTMSVTHFTPLHSDA